MQIPRVNLSWSSLFAHVFVLQLLLDFFHTVSNQIYQQDAYYFEPYAKANMALILIMSKRAELMISFVSGVYCTLTFA